MVHSQSAVPAVHCSIDSIDNILLLLVPAACADVFCQVAFSTGERLFGTAWLQQQTWQKPPVSS